MYSEKPDKTCQPCTSEGDPMVTQLLYGSLIVVSVLTILSLLFAYLYDGLVPALQGTLTTEGNFALITNINEILIRYKVSRILDAIQGKAEKCVLSCVSICGRVELVLM